MKTTIKKYDPNTDFLRIREFLIETFSLYGKPFNWLIDRWNFCRYFVLPVHTFYNTRYFSVPTQIGPSHRDELPYWEESIRIWENWEGNIVGVLNSSNEEPGEAWIQVHPDYTFLYEEMVETSEEILADKVGTVGFVKLYINEGTQLEEIAQARGYKQLKERIAYLEYELHENSPLQLGLPNGYSLKSVADEDDVEKRRKAKSIAFGANYFPSHWPPASAFVEMQKAPDYRKDLDLFIVAPNGEYVSFGTIWLDLKNKYGNFEPVGTQPEYQGMGLGRVLIMEGLKRMAQYGIRRSFMDSLNPFYRKVGFKDSSYVYSPWIKYFSIDK